MLLNFLSVTQSESEDSIIVFGVITGLVVAITIGALHYVRGNVGVAVWLGGVCGLFSGYIAAILLDNGQNPLWILLSAFCLAAIVGVFTSMLE